MCGMIVDSRRLLRKKILSGWACVACITLVTGLFSAEILMAQSPGAWSGTGVYDGRQSDAVGAVDASGSSQSAGENRGQSDEEAIPTGNLFATIQSGGLLMVPLLGCSFVLAAFALERLVNLRWGHVVPHLFVDRFLEQLQEGQLSRDEALDACEANGSPASDVFAAAVKRWGRPAVEIEQAVIDSSERVIGRLRRYRRVFHGISTVGPLLGLLGTVFGLIRSFNDVASAGAMGRPDLLARGFGEALITTAMGLLVAIPAMILHWVFTSRVDRIAMRLDETSQQVIDEISAESSSDTRRRSRSRGKRDEPGNKRAA